MELACTVNFHKILDFNRYQTITVFSNSWILGWVDTHHGVEKVDSIEVAEIAVEGADDDDDDICDMEDFEDDDDLVIRKFFLMG